MKDMQKTFCVDEIGCAKVWDRKVLVHGKE